MKINRTKILQYYKLIQSFVHSLEVVDCGMSTAKSPATTRAVRHGIDMTLVLYEMWDYTVWD
jgi:hypothetical protein